MIELNNVHFIGIGGVSMKALAIYTAHYAKKVTGSDREYSEAFKILRESGIEVWQGSDVSKLGDVDTLVYSSAVPSDDPEFAYLTNKGVKSYERGEYLALMASTCGRTIAVSGTHGKTTTSALIAHIMATARMPFVAHYGGSTEESGDKNLIVTGREYFLTEACEYKRSFLNLTPYIGVILNIDYDHPDCYSDINEVKDTFLEFSRRSEITVCPSELNIEDAITFGYGEDADYRILNEENTGGRYSFDLLTPRGLTSLESNLFGKHNVYNVTVAYMVTSMIGLSDEEIAYGISTFSGVKRRFECKGKTLSGARVISDYAHHPKEIASVIDTARSMSKGRITVLFEPHTYSRTAKLMDEFVECFYWADDVALLPTYSARERSERGKSSLDLYYALIKSGRGALYMDSYDKAIEYIESHTAANDMVLVLGAGSIHLLADALTNTERDKDLS